MFPNKVCKNYPFTSVKNAIKKKAIPQIKKTAEKHLLSLLRNTPTVFPTNSNTILSFLQVSCKFLTDHQDWFKNKSCLEQKQYNWQKHSFCLYQSLTCSQQGSHLSFSLQFQIHKNAYIFYSNTLKSAHKVSYFHIEQQHSSHFCKSDVLFKCYYS